MKLKDYYFVFFGILFGVSVSSYIYRFGLDKEFFKIYVFFIFPAILFIAFSVNNKMTHLRHFLFPFIFISLLISLFCVIGDKVEYIKIEKYVVIYIFIAIFGNILKKILNEKDIK